MSRTTLTSKTVRGDSGRTYRLKDLLASEGEGSIWSIESAPDIVAKIYHAAPDARHVSKLRSFEQLPFRDHRDKVRFASPMDVVYSTDGLLGFIMIRAVGPQMIYLCSRQLRAQLDWTIDKAFLLSIAANVAEAFVIAHDAKCIIGDVNPKNIIVDSEGSITIIDCDSMQIPNPQDAADPYRCTVGMPEYQPPELTSFDVRRTRNHDAFSLALLLFNLLYDGHPPYLRGNVPGMAGPVESTQDAIRLGTYIFRYPEDRRPYALRGQYSKTVDDLWDRVFDVGHADPAARPAASEWVTALREVHPQLLAVQRLRAALRDGNPTAVYQEYRILRRSTLLTKAEHDLASRSRPDASTLLADIASAHAHSDASEMEHLLTLLEGMPGVSADYARLHRGLEQLHREAAVAFRLALHSGIDAWARWAAEAMNDQSRNHLSFVEKTRLDRYKPAVRGHAPGQINTVL